MARQKEIDGLTEKLTLELRRGTLVLAALSQLESARYGYSLVQRLADQGLDVEQGTLYPLLRRLDEQGLLHSEWDVAGARPRKYYRLSSAGVEILRTLSEQWDELVEVMAGLLDNISGGKHHGSD